MTSASPSARRAAAAIAACLIATALAAPGARALTSDRPDAAESAWTVGHLRLQLETGVDVAFDGADGARSTILTLPSKLRFGILDFFELHLQSAALVYDRTTPKGADTDADVRGADLDFGFKFHALDGDGYVPAVAVLLSVTAPVGSPQVTADAWLVSPIFALEWTLPLDIALAVNAGYTTPLTDRDRVGDVVVYALSIGRSLAPAADFVGLFVQVFGESPLDAGETTLQVGGGATFQVLEDLQFDVYVNGGVVDAAPDVTVGGGLAFRL